MKIRPIQRKDFEPLLLFVDLMHRESPAYRDWPVTREKMMALGEQIIEHPERFCGLVAEQAGRLQGMFAGYLGEAYFGPDRIASDLALFVVPDRRGSLAAAGMLRWFVEWAKDQGARAVQLGITTGVHQERTAALYRRFGFEPFGIVCRKLLTGGV